MCGQFGAIRKSSNQHQSNGFVLQQSPHMLAIIWEYLGHKETPWLEECFAGCCGVSMHWRPLSVTLQESFPWSTAPPEHLNDGRATIESFVKLMDESFGSKEQLPV